MRSFKSPRITRRPHRRDATGPSHPRAGLAPLELVLSLPILLFVMGLMVVFGTAAAWKVRTLAVSREAVWRTVPSRTGANDRHPQGWPTSAQMRVQDASPSLFEADPFVNYAVVRGPVIVEPHTGLSLPVKDGTLDMEAGLKSGVAHIQRGFPLLGNMPPREFDFTRHHQLLSGSRWQYRSMGIRTNVTRRIPFLYPMQFDGVEPALTSRFTQSALDIVTNPNKPALTPLEGGDPEIVSLTGRRSPDFQPQARIPRRWTTIPAVRTRVPLVCEADPATLYNDEVQPLLDNIAHVPHRMTDYYTGVYSGVIARLQSRMPISPAAQALIRQLQAKVDQLRRFRDTLPP